MKVGVLMDDIQTINPKKDTTLAMLWEAHRRGAEVYYFQQADLFADQDNAFAKVKRIETHESLEHWFDVLEESVISLADLDCILMRKDPPFDMEYIYSTYLLEMAERAGCLIVNKPASIRACNEKVFATQFSEFAPATRISRDMDALRAFLKEQQKIVVKPLDGMGGEMIFQMSEGDANTSVILETITDKGQRTVMAQAFLPEFVEGDKRVLVVDGEVIPYGLLRVPAKGESRGNLAAGAQAVPTELTPIETRIAQAIAPALKNMGLMFVGLDIIGDKVTEINVTSPTCVRELDDHFGINIAGVLFDAIEKRLN